MAKSTEPGKHQPTQRNLVFPRWPPHFFEVPDRDFWQRRLDVSQMEDLLKLAEHDHSVAWQKAIDKYSQRLERKAFEAALGMHVHDFGRFASTFHNLGHPRETWAYPALHLLLVARFIKRKHADAIRDVLEVSKIADPEDWVRDKGVERRAVGLLLYAHSPRWLVQVRAISQRYSRNPSTYRLDLGPTRRISTRWRKELQNLRKIEDCVGAWREKHKSRPELVVERPFTFGPSDDIVISLRKTTRPRASDERGRTTETAQFSRMVLVFGNEASLSITASSHKLMASLADIIAERLLHPQGSYVADELVAGLDEVTSFLDSMLWDRGSKLKAQAICYEARQLQTAPLTTLRRRSVEPFGKTLEEIGCPSLVEYPDAVLELEASFMERDVTFVFPRPGAPRVIRHGLYPADDKVRKRLIEHVHTEFGIRLASVKTGKPKKGFRTRMTEEELERTYLWQGVTAVDPGDLVATWLKAQAHAKPPLLEVQHERCVRCDDPRYSGGRHGEGCPSLVRLWGTSVLWDDKNADRPRDVESGKLVCERKHELTDPGRDWRAVIWRYQVDLNFEVACDVVHHVLTALGLGRILPNRWMDSAVDGDVHVACLADKNDPLLERLIEGRRAFKALLIIWMGRRELMTELKMRLPGGVVAFVDVYQDGVQAIQSFMHRPGGLPALPPQPPDNRVVLSSDAHFVYLRGKKLTTHAGGTVHVLLWLLARKLNDLEPGQLPDELTEATASEELLPFERIAPTGRAFDTAMGRLRREYVLRWLPDDWSEQRRLDAFCEEEGMYWLDPAEFRVVDLHPSPPRPRTKPS